MNGNAGKYYRLAILAAGIGVGISLCDPAIAQSTAPSDPPIFSSATRPGDTAVLHVTEPGCWSTTRYRLEYTAHPTPRVTVFVQWYRDAKTGVQMSGDSLRLLGTVTLTPAQVERLDERLRQIRSFRGIDDRNDDTATFTLIRAGRKIYSEDFVSFPIGISTLEDGYTQDIEAIPDSPYKALWYSGSRPVLSLRRLEEIAEQSGDPKKPLPYRDLRRDETTAWRIIHEDEIVAEHKRAKKQKTDEILANLPGRATVEKSFVVRKVRQARYTTYGDTLTAEMTARSGRLIDDVTWYNLLKDGKPTQDWSALAKVAEAVEALVSKMPWLATWKASNSENSIHMLVIGDKPFDEEEPEDDVFPAWRHAGLRGLPDYKLTLYRGNGGWMTVFGNREEDRLLVTYVNPADNPDSRFWFDSLDLDYEPVQKVPQYAVINPDGTGKRNTRSDAKRATQYARENRMNLQE